MTYTDIAVVVLAGVTVMVTVLAVFIGILAIWGYSQFEKMTKSASEKHLEKVLGEAAFLKKIEDIVVKHVSDQLTRGELRDVLISRVDQIIIADAEERSKHSDAPDEPTQFKD